jgi:hypothetical protein
VAVSLSQIREGIDMKPLRISLRIVFYKEEGQWIAHCLEFDLCGNGPTKRDASASLCEAMAIQIKQTVEHNNTKNLFVPADGEFFQMFAAGENIARADLSMTVCGDEDVVIESTESRVYADDDLMLA